jgi:drug/metabolite transporter (DMT)-like permease
MAFAALSIIWGVPYFFVKLALQELSPIAIAWGRVVLGTLILLPIAWKRGALRAVLDYKAAVCAFALVEFVIPFSAVPWRLMGLLLGFVGVATLLGFGTISGLPGWTGVGCMLLAVLGYAIGPLIIQRHLGDIDSFGPVAASLLVASIVLLPAASFAFPAHIPTPLVLWSIAILGAVCTALAMLLMFYLIGHAGASRASVITYINPAVATLLGVSLLKEHLESEGLAAFALILLGSWLATRGTATQPRKMSLPD